MARLRQAGLSLEAAVDSAARRHPAARDRTVHAGLRRRHPDLEVLTLRKRTLLALTRSVEEEVCARASRPWLLASFQHARHYARARSRWEDLARTARCTLVLGVFSEMSSRRSGPGRPTPVHVPVDAPMRREWSLVCDTPEHPGALAAWELPGQDGVPER